MAGVEYTIRTTLPPEEITRIGMEIFRMWVDFALGIESLDGKRLVYPTGRYAASIEFKQTGAASVAIVTNDSVAPEADILEYGHGSVDLKSKLRHGRAYPMHRPAGDVPHMSSTGLRRVGSGPPSLKPRMWARIRSREGSGFASIGPESTGWVIPSMTPYAPAQILSNMLQQMLGS